MSRIGVFVSVSAAESTAEGVEAAAAVEGAEDAGAGSVVADSVGDPPGAEALGEPGKKALDAMKSERNAYKSELSELRAEFDAFRAAAEGREAEHAAAVEAQRVKDEALAAANERIRKAEVRAVAAGKLADPSDALRFLDLSSVEVGEDGEVDSGAVSALVDALLTERPYLAAQAAGFAAADAGGPGAGNSGRTDAGPSQLSRADLQRMTDDQINEARAAGRLKNLMSGS